MASPVTAAAMRHPSHDRKALVAMLGWLRAQWIEQGSPAYMADLSGELIYANDAMEALLDLPLEYWHGDHPLSVRAFIAGDVVSELGRGTGPFTCRLRITTTGGATDFRSAHRFLSDPDGKPACIAGQFELTDDRPLVRQAVERFDDIGRLVADWIWETDRTFTITYVTNRVTQALGLLPVELQGRKLFDLGAFEDSADRKLASDLMNGSRMPFRDRYFVMPTKSGPCRTFRLSGLPVFDTRDGSFSGYRGTALDVSDALAAETRARSAQQRLEDALETIVAGFLLVDQDGRVVLANHQMGTLYPQIADQLLPGAAPGALFSGLAAAGHMRLEQAEVDGATTDDRGAVVQPPGGDWVSQLYMPPPADIPRYEQVIALSDGRVLRVRSFAMRDGGAVSIHSEITRERTREVALQSANESLKLADRAKSEFLANVSHELRTPLNAIIGFSDIIHNQSFGPVGQAQYVDYAGSILASGRHLLELINDLLDTAKAESGKLELNVTEVDLAGVLNTCCRLIQARAHNGAVSVSCAPLANPILINGDELKLKQILLNLLSNAVKFTPQGGRVDVTAEVSDDGACRITVTDTGIGMAEEDIPRAMAPFVQIDNSLTRHHDGTGLGLPLAEAYAVLHDGSLEITSEIGVGSSVALILPAWRVVSGRTADPTGV